MVLQAFIVRRSKMAYCKTSKRIPLVIRQTYRKGEIFPNLDSAENMGSTYFDPLRNELFSFIKENNPDYDNTFQPPVFTYRSRSGAPIREAETWEKTKIRHLFFQRNGMNDGDYEYLGTSLDERNTRNANGELMQVEYEVQ
jgi:hypothetical protein